MCLFSNRTQHGWQELPKGLGGRAKVYYYLSNKAQILVFESILFMLTMPWGCLNSAG